MSFISGDIKVGSISQLRNVTNIELKQFKSFYCDESGKEGFWEYDPNDTTSIDNLGTIIVTTSGARLKRVINGGDIYPEWFGAVGDGITDDYQSIQTTMDYTLYNDNKTVKFINSIYKINNRLTLDSYHTSISGNCLLDFSNSSNGAFLIVASIGNEGGASYGKKGVFSGNLRIKGNGKLQSSIGIEFNSSVEYSNSNLQFNNLSIFQFGVGISFKNRAYNSLFQKCEIFECNECITMESNFTDYGEKITFISCVLYNSNLAVKNKNPNGAFHFISCSFDYNQRQLDIDTGRAFYNNCHLESNTYSTEPIVISGNGGFASIQGGWILCTGNNSQSFCNVNSGSSIVINGTFINNVGSAKYFNSGTGRCIVNNTQSYSVSNNPRLIGVNENTVINYDFDSNDFIDGMITGDTSTITSKTQGSNMKMTISTDQSFSGTKSLFLQKQYGGGSVAQCVLFARIRERSTPVYEFKYRKPNTQSGNIYISKTFFNITDDIIPIINRKESYGSTILDVSLAETSWVTFSSGEPRISAPAWATHVGVEFNFDSFVGSNQGIYVDNFEVNYY